MTSSSRPASRETAIHLICMALLAGVLVIDATSPMGYAAWALYVLPIGLSLFQRIAWMPLFLAGVATVLMGIGLFLSPEGPTSGTILPVVNRAMGLAICWGMGGALWQMISARNRVQDMLWLQQSEALAAQRLLGLHTPASVASSACQVLSELTGASTAVLYRLDGDILVREGGYALDTASTPERIGIQDGVLGQVARTNTLQWLHDLPAQHLSLSTALGHSAPAHALVAPLAADQEVRGVVELGFTGTQVDTERLTALLRALSDNVAESLRSAVYRERLELLLTETRSQAEQLQAQQEELRVSNEELEEQGRVLRESQARLETQQVELEQTNVQLEEQTQALERQKIDLLKAQTSLQENAERLEMASRYKSEFLANMSHELRTPLNSSLILAQLLAENKEETLTSEQVKYAQAIHASNNDLLVLINDILDLSKIEAGHLDLDVQPAPLTETIMRLRATFEPLAQHKGLRFAVHMDPNTPATLETDALRLQQVLKNLLANAVKFTEQGEVSLAVRPAGDRVLFEVRDSGVGIPKHQQDIIFEAFRQADGSTSRRYGGTGLGLSISRELAQRLGGQITVDSEPGRGSVFTVDLPRHWTAAAPAPRPSAQALPAAVPAPSPYLPPAQAPAPAAALPAPSPTLASTPPASAPGGASSATQAANRLDDRLHRTHPGRMILVVEDDARFAQVLYDLAHELGFDCVVAPNGQEALDIARDLQPGGILLDVGLPDQSGLTVLERLKRDPVTRHIPVHMMSAHERAQTARELGAVGYVQKPAARGDLAIAIGRLQERLQREVRRVLIVEDDEQLRASLVALLQSEQVQIDAVGSVANALSLLAQHTFDCMVMDLTLSDGTGYDLLEKMADGEQYAFPPVIVYTGRALSRDEEHRLRRHSKSIIVKGARSPERLLDEVTLFLHSVESNLPPEQQRLLRQARQRDSVLDGRRILLVEDDVRNIFALSSVFEPLGAKLEIARNGREALEQLEKQPGVELVLMDIMMPEMDGLTAMRHIRAKPEWANLPVIALTAKAMPDDRDNCLEAGANDYVAKPIDITKLVSLCRVWMPK